MKTILVFDSNPERRKGHCKALATIGFTVWQWKDEEISAVNKRANGTVPQTWDLILLHALSSDARTFKSKNIAGPVLHYGGGGSQSTDSVPRPVNADSPLTGDELRRFTDCFFGAGNGSVPIAVAATWSQEPELAFRLLCEAKKECGSATKAKLSGITIHAPAKLKDWLAPFGKNPEDANAIDDVAGLIGSGEIKIRAEAVLSGVNGNGETLTRAIETFLKPQANPPAQP